jgi:hypothetical protein
VRNLLIGLLFSVSAFGASNVQQSIDQLGSTGTYVLSFNWEAASDGTVPVTASKLQGCCQGYSISVVETIPGNVAPTSGYSVQILDGAGVDVLGGGAASLSATAGQTFLASPAATPLQGAISLSISGQAVSGAKGRVMIFLQKPGTVNLAQLNRSQLATGYILDANYSSLASACVAATPFNATVVVTRTWSNLLTQTIACPLFFLAGGILKPAASQTVTLTGTLTASPSQQIFDISASTANVKPATSANPYSPSWYGADASGSADSNAAIQAAINDADDSGGVVQFTCGIFKFTGLTISTRITMRGGGNGEVSSSATPCTKLIKTADATGIDIASAAGLTILEGFQLTSTAVAGTADGIVVGGVDSTNGAGEVTFRNITVTNQRGNGINVRNGNSGFMEHVIANQNTLNGILISNQNTSVDNTNAWRLFGVSAIGNGRDGLSADTAANTSVSSGIFEGNGRYGFYCNRSSMNFGNIYLEGNVTNNAKTTSSCFGGTGNFLDVNGTFSQDNFGNWFYSQSNPLMPYLYGTTGRMGARAGFGTKLVTPTYGASITINNDLGNSFLITATNSTNFTVTAPSNQNLDQEIDIIIQNSSGGNLGIITWPINYTLGSPFTSPLNGYYRSIRFRLRQDTGRWVEISRSLSDVGASSARADYTHYSTDSLAPLTGQTTSGATAAFVYPNIAVQSIWRTSCMAYTTTAGAAGTVQLNLQPRNTGGTLAASGTLDLTSSLSIKNVSITEIIPAATAGRYVGVQYLVTGNVGGIFTVECVTERVQ